MTDTTMIHGLGVALAFGAMISPPPQSYRLIEINGSAAEVEKEWNCRDYVTRGALTLGADSLWSLRVTLREVCGDRDTLRFFDDGDDDRESGEDVDLDDLKSGTVGEDGTLTVRLEDDETTLVFRK